MGYYNELKGIRKELRSELRKAGVKASVTGNSGSSLFWTNISSKGDQWGNKELKILKEDFGIHVGHPSNSPTIPMEKLKANLGGYKQKGFKRSKKYQDFRDDFRRVASQQADTGTCCLGAGTIVQRKGQDIDFIRQVGQSETRNAVAQKIMQQKAENLGLKLKLEYGKMD
jgi:hypothetical protein